MSRRGPSLLREFAEIDVGAVGHPRECTPEAQIGQVASWVPSPCSSLSVSLRPAIIRGAHSSIVFLSSEYSIPRKETLQNGACFAAALLDNRLRRGCGFSAHQNLKEREGQRPWTLE